MLIWARRWEGVFCTLKPCYDPGFTYVFTFVKNLKRKIPEALPLDIKYICKSNYLQIVSREDPLGPISENVAQW